MKHWLLSTLMVVTVILFLFLKATGRIRLSEMNPVSAFGLKLVLFIVATGFFGVSLIKILHALVGYNSTPLDIALYGATLLLAGGIAFLTMRWLTAE